MSNKVKIVSQIFLSNGKSNEIQIKTQLINVKFEYNLIEI